MKKIFTQIFLGMCFSASTFAQSKSNSWYLNGISIIDEIKKEIYFIENADRLITSGVILFELAFLIMILYYWKKTRFESKSIDENKYKKNIKALRDERIKPVINNSVTKKRNSLGKIINLNTLNGKTICAKAKELNISKGELYLAAKIKQLSSQTR